MCSVLQAKTKPDTTNEQTEKTAFYTNEWKGKDERCIMNSSAVITEAFLHGKCLVNYHTLTILLGEKNSKRMCFVMGLFMSGIYS